MTDRRVVLRLLMAGGAACVLPVPVLAERPRATSTLPNGLRIHCAPTASRYISAALTLRSRLIMGPGGLAHILEHTSFTGAAGAWTSKEVKDRYTAFLHDANASTSPGLVQWQASFLPRHAAEALELLAITSLDQKFDVETVASEARVVLQELYLEKYDSEAGLKRRFDATLYGSEHPFARVTTDEEIAKARTPPGKLAAELRAYAQTIRLPANMDLFVVGGVAPETAERLAAATFGRFAHAGGPHLELPRVRATRSHHDLVGTSQQLKRPMSEIKIAWNTGVTITDAEVTVLVALGHYMNDLIAKELREKAGDAYSPEVTFRPDQCSGIFTISITSNKHPAAVEARVLKMVESLKSAINADELAHFKDRFEITRLKTAESNAEVLNCMVERVLQGGSTVDCDIGTVSAERLQLAAQKYLPSHRGGYVRAVLRGI